MFIAKDLNGVRISTDKALRGEKYICPTCESEVFFKKCVNISSHFAHKSRQECDSWHNRSNVMSEWHRKWQGEFNEEYREITLRQDGKLHRADVKIDDIVIEFQHSRLSQQDFLERTEFYSKENQLIWIFDLTEKEVFEVPPTDEQCSTRHFAWYKPFNYDFDIHELREKYNVDIYFETKLGLIKLYWNNKEDLKKFGGYIYNRDRFVKYVKKRKCLENWRSLDTAGAKKNSHTQQKS